jgi:membrane protein DedA with SNARE-associated domain
MHIHIQLWVQHYGYPGIFFILLFEMIGMPLPAETTLVISGIEWNKGILMLTPLLITAITGHIIGSTLAYSIGRFLGRSFIMRFGKWVGLTSERLDKVNIKFHKYGKRIIFAAKFIAGIRVLVPFLAGINRMSFVKFTLYNIISSMVWVTVFVFAGKYLGRGWVHWHKSIHHYILPFICILIIVACLFFMIKSKRAKAKLA